MESFGLASIHLGQPYPQHLDHPSVTRRERASGLHVLGDRQRRSVMSALVLTRLGELEVRNDEVALPSGIVAVQHCEPFADGEALGVGALCSGKVALSRPGVADPVPDDREVALQADVAGVLPGELLEYCQAVRVGAQRTG